MICDMIQWRLRCREAALSLSRARDTRSPPLDLPEATPLNLAFAYRMFRNDVLDFSRQLIAGVAYLHGRGIAYLDIKPQNIVVRVRCAYRSLVRDSRMDGPRDWPSGRVQVFARPQVSPYGLSCGLAV